MFAAEVDRFAVGEPSWWAVAQVVERDHATGHAVRDLRVRGDREELVHRAAFVGLDMAERDPAQACERHDAGDGLRHQRKHPPRAGVEERRLVGVDEELVEREAPGCGVRHAGRQAVDALGDFVDTGVHGDGP